MQDISLAYRNTVIAACLTTQDGKMMVFPFSYVNLIEANVFIENRSEVNDGQGRSAPPGECSLVEEK